VGLLLKSLLTGLFAALAAGVLALVAPIAFGELRIWWDVSDGAGGIGAYVVDIPGLRTVIAMPIGFALGVYWQIRRGRAR
jgi:hypothetical protein